MKKIFKSNIVFVVALLAGSLGVLGVASAQFSNRKLVTPPKEVGVNASLTEQARMQLSEGRPMQALALARRAAQEDANDYKAEYYGAFALMELGELEAALKAVERSANLAKTQDAKTAVQELNASLTSQKGIKEGDAALADGLYAKAGRLYLSAWEKGVLPPDKTLLAANIFQTQLKAASTAAQMLRELQKREEQTPAAKEAAARLASLAPSLQVEANLALDQARKLEPSNLERAKWLQAVLDADADNQEVHVMLANDAAEAGSWPVLEARLKILQRKGWLETALADKQLSLGEWQKDGNLQSLLAGIWGAKRGADLLALNTTKSQPLSVEAKNAQVQRSKAMNIADFNQAGLKAGTSVAFRDCPECPQMVCVPPGNLPQRDATNQPLVQWLNKVHIDYPLAVGKHEVTFSEWDLCVAGGACRADVPEGFTDGVLIDTKWGRGQQPVVNVHWDDARAYTQWLSKRTGENYRLLSLPEFTYAARAGRTDNNLVAQGANCRDCISNSMRTMPVATYAANAWGLHDMVGNVNEMVADCSLFRIANTDLSKRPIDGSAVSTGCGSAADGNGLSTLGALMVAMGGSFAEDLQNRGVTVGEGWERYGTKFMGFRVARTFSKR